MASKTEFVEILWGSPTVMTILNALEQLGLPQGCLCAGCVTQTVWNAKYGMPALHGIDDADIIYFDDGDLSYAAENDVLERVHAQLSGLPIRLDVKNEARVHLWYPEKFGYEIAPYQSVGDAIASFPTTATAIGVRLCRGEMEIIAPYGLEDLMAGIVRPNRVQITREVYMGKAQKWKQKWPDLIVQPWEA